MFYTLTSLALKEKSVLLCVHAHLINQFYIIHFSFHLDEYVIWPSYAYQTYHLGLSVGIRFFTKWWGAFFDEFFDEDVRQKDRNLGSM